MRTTNDGILSLEVIWRCPVCNHRNSEIGIFPYEPVRIAEGFSLPSETFLPFTALGDSVSCDCPLCAGTSGTLGSVERKLWSK